MRSVLTIDGSRVLIDSCWSLPSGELAISSAASDGWEPRVRLRIGNAQILLSIGDALAIARDLRTQAIETRELVPPFAVSKKKEDEA